MQANERKGYIMANKANQKTTITSFLAKYWLILFAVLVGIAFGLVENRFFQFTNLLNILGSACVSAIAGIGLTCIMSVGEMDFAAGTEMSLGCVLMVWILKNTPVNNYLLTVLLTLVILAVVGLVNSFLHIKIGMPAFIATMGTSYLINGVNKGLTGGKSMLGVGSTLAKEFNFIGQKYLFGVIPMPMVMLIIVGTVVLIYTERTRSGKHLYAVGSNPQACKYIGINANKEKIKGFVLCSVLCGFAGILQGSMVNGATASIGDNSMISSITVLMLGATFVKMGVFNVPGTIVGAVLLAIVNNGLTMVGADSYVKSFVQGFILFGAVTVVVVLKKRLSKSV